MSKKIISSVIALSAIFAFVAVASAAGYTFSTNLMVGSSGADVSALQTFLSANGFLTMPAGVSMGYFGGLTKSALMKYQASKGLPATGFFGPMTRAAIGSSAGSTGSTGSTGGTSTGTPGCPAGAMFNYMTGASCSSTTSTSTTGTTVSLGDVEGTLDVRQAGSPANNSNIQTSTDIPVFGLTLKATIAPVQVDRFDLSVKNLNGSSYENPANLINTIKAWSGTTLLKTWNVTSADFIKNPNDSTEYYIRMSGIGLMIGKDETKDLTFSVSTNSGIDTSRVVTLKGYGSNSLRVVSGNNITSYYSDASSFTRTQTFKKPGSATLTVSSDSTTPKSNNYKISATDSTTGVVVGTFNVKSETGDSQITDVSTQVVATGDLPSTLYLYDGSTMIDSRAVSAIGTTTVSFTNLSSKINVAKDQTKTLTFKVDMPASSTATAVSSVSAGASTTVSYLIPNGTTNTVMATGLNVYKQYFYRSAAMFTFVSGTATAGGVNQQGSTTAPSATFTFTVKPSGASLLPFANGSTTVVFGSNLASATSTGVSTNVTYSPNDSTLADGGSYTVTVSATVSPASNAAISAGNSIVTFYITNIGWVTSTGVNVSQTYGLEDYKTNPITITK